MVGLHWYFLSVTNDYHNINKSPDTRKMEKEISDSTQVLKFFTLTEEISYREQYYSTYQANILRFQNPQRPSYIKSGEGKPFRCLNSIYTL
jgi:hypothetical protein